MNKQPIISVIVPVYNVENYLKDCLNSIIQQTYEKLEIIIVDDGSTDDSGQICDIFAKKDKRIWVIHQENHGVALTRRDAVLRASGDYICFADADDKMDEDMIAFLFRNIDRCDLITCGCYCERETGDYFEQTDCIEEGIYDNEKLMDYVIANMLIYRERFDYGVLPYLFNKMFKAALLKEVVLGIQSTLSYGEDGEVLFQYILRSKAVCITHKCMYYYRYRADSALRAVNRNYMSDLNGIYLALEKAFEKHPQKEVLMHQLQLFVTARIYAIPLYMGFSVDAWITGYVFPFADLKTGSKVVLYGAGRIGMRYYRQIYRQKLLQIVLWIDKNWRQYANSFLPISAPEELEKHSYDYIIIAVKGKALAEEIRLQLVARGIAEEQILWREPALL